MDVVRTVVFVLVWTFVTLLVYMIGNTVLFGYVSPVMDDAAASAGYSTFYTPQNTNIAKTSFNVACFILILTPYAYLFVRLLFKREPTSPTYNPGGGGF
jgi:hypothetical protein